MSAKRKSTQSVRSATAPYGKDGKTVADALYSGIRMAGHYTSGDQSAPCAILWTDPERLWELIISDLKKKIPELFVFGAYDPDKRTGPAVWLRCIEAGVIENPIPPDRLPVFYLPGISRQQLREVEDCPAPLQPLVELQFRGTVWHHPNGKDWTPYAYLVSDHGGLGLEVAKDTATFEALQRSLDQLMKEEITGLQGKRLDAEFFNELLAPDLPRLILSWMSEPAKIRAGKSPEEWKAFCQQCMSEYTFHPEKDGELRAAELLGWAKQKWEAVWKRFREAPQRYPGVVALLEKVDPTARGQLIFNKETWPTINDEAEKELNVELRKIKEKRPDEAVAAIRNLEKEHAHRRGWVWRELGRSQFAVALEHLDRLAVLVEKPLTAASVQELGELYSSVGWEADSEAIAALACCTSLDHEEPISVALRSLYLPWLEASARNLQKMVKVEPDSIRPHMEKVESAEGRVILFVDGLRFDLARHLSDQLKTRGLHADLAWDWSPFPGVTPTAKPHVSPIAHLLTGSPHAHDFSVLVAGVEKQLTQDRFRGLLAENNHQVLGGMSHGDPSGRAWTEMGAFDPHGHNEGWKVAKRIRQEIGDIETRIYGLLEAGWREVIIVTDHGWIIMPEGFPKVELPKFLLESRWGRCAAMKETAVTDMPILPWFWNKDVAIASPHGVACFRAGIEYSHGGISLQELVVPRMTVKRMVEDTGKARIADCKWVGLRCRVTVQEPGAGLRVDLRRRSADPDSSVVEGKASRALSSDATVSLPVTDPDIEGTGAIVVLLDAEGKILDQFPTIVGGNT